MTERMQTKQTRYKKLKVLLALMLALFAATVIFAASASKTYAADPTPIREAHKISVNGKNYCFFVVNNVVLTPKNIAEWKEEIQKKVETERKEEIEKEAEKEIKEEYPEVTDEEELKRLIDERVKEKIDKIVDQELKEKVADEILTRSGLYMKQTNCKKAKHKAIDLKTWNEKICKLTFSDEDLDEFIKAVPQDGDPHLVYMHLYYYKKNAEGVFVKERLTHKMAAAELMLVANATENDAANPEDVCKESKVKKKEKKKTVPKPTVPKEKEEMLPEMRTIPMPDRSGDPLKATLEDGSPVTLEWIDPGSDPEKDGSFWDKLPGGILTPIALLLGLLLLLILLLKRRKRNDSE